MLKIVEHSAAQRQTQQNEFVKFFAKFLRKEGTDSNGNYRARCIAECAEHINAVDHSGRSLLHWATIDGDFEAVQFLVAHGHTPTPSGSAGCRNRPVSDFGRSKYSRKEQLGKYSTS